MKIEINLTDEQVRKFFCGNTAAAESPESGWRVCTERRDYPWEETPAREAKSDRGNDTVLTVYKDLLRSRERLLGNPGNRRTVLMIDDLIDHLENVLAED